MKANRQLLGRLADRARHLVRPDARHASPGRRARGVVVSACALILLAGCWGGWFLLSVPSRTATLNGAYEFLEAPPRLQEALDVEWRLAVRDPGEDFAVWADSILSPPMPPPLCVGRLASGASGRRVVSTGGGVSLTVQASAVDRLVRSAERAVAEGDRAALRNAVEGLREASYPLSGDIGAVARYALALASAAADDLAGAARLLETLADTAGLPMASSGSAAGLVRAGRFGRPQVVLAFQSRYLAGVVAHRRELPTEAIAHFRRALNAVNYALADPANANKRGHYERVVMPPGILSCSGADTGGLTSLDAYAGLVTAYLSASDFRDSSRLPGEVRRRAYEMDPTDPLAPLLAYAGKVARSPRDSAVGEHILWAGSNLQRVYHFNRIRPDPRLSLTRAAFILRALDEPEWMAAIGTDEEARCEILAQVADDFRLHGVVSGGPSDRFARADSALAAVAVNTFARLESCNDGDATLSDDLMRDRLLAFGGALLRSAIISRYDQWRRRLQEGSAGDEEHAARVLRQVASDERDFARGRAPLDMIGMIDPSVGETFVRDWVRGVFSDVAEQLKAQADDERARQRIRQADAGRYLRTLEGAVAHAGLRPSDLYRAEDMEFLVRSAGSAEGLRHGLRYRARSFPVVAAGLLTLLTSAGLALAGVTFVGWWRFNLLVRSDLYKEQQREPPQ